MVCRSGARAVSRAVNRMGGRGGGRAVEQPGRPCGRCRTDGRSAAAVGRSVERSAVRSDRRSVARALSLPHLAEICQNWSSPGQFRPIPGNRPPDFGRIRAEVDRKCPTSTKIWWISAQPWPNSAQFWSTHIWAMLTGVGPIWASIGAHSKNLHGPHSGAQFSM